MMFMTAMPELMIVDLMSPQAVHVPFRNSKLTYLLEGDLKGDSKVTAPPYSDANMPDNFEF